jgi:alpha-D-ribose 1-methylphosphonate 5-phosphate C-P lyase
MSKRIEEEWFGWTGWDDQEAGVLCFYGCTLKKQIGALPPWTKVSFITLDFQQSIIELMVDDTSVPLQHHVSLTIGDVKR